MNTKEYTLTETEKETEMIRQREREMHYEREKGEIKEGRLCLVRGRGERRGEKKCVLDQTIEIRRVTYFGFGNDIDCGGTELKKEIPRPTTLIGAVIGQKYTIIPHFVSCLLFHSSPPPPPALSDFPIRAQP